MTTRITGPNGETIGSVYWPPRTHLTLDTDGVVISQRPATTWEITRWQVRELMRRWLP